MFYFVWNFFDSCFHDCSVQQAATVGDKIYVLGGKREEDLYNSHKYKSVECYNKKTNTWSFVSDLNSPRHGVTAGILGNDLVAVG